MKRALPYLSLLAVCAACAARDTPPPRERLPPGTHPAAAAAPTVYAVLGHRAELGLTPAQVAAIDSIGDWLQRRNAPLLDSLRLRDGRSRLERGAADVLLDGIAANQRAAVDGVAAALTEDQRARVCRLFAEERDTRRRGSRPALARRPRGAARWGWCAAPGPARPPA